MAFGYLDGLFHVSHDAGEHWEARGRIAGSSKVAATRLWILPPTEEHRRILVVHGNGGTQIGGSPHWPESDAAIHVSTDDGWTWQEAWSPSDQVVVALDSELVGPLPAAGGRPAWWLLRLEDVVLRSEDGGAHWQQVFLPEDPGAYPLAALPDGTVLVAPGEPGLPRAVAVDEFEVGVPPTPRPGH